MDDFFKEIGFPYSSLRKGQDLFIRKVFDSIGLRKNILVSAPTGLGKTVSALAPAIYYGKKNSKKVIVLTSRQTQANQVIKTIRDISNFSKKNIKYAAFIGKRSMCVHEDRDLYPSSDFNDFCSKLRKSGKCGHYLNSKNSEFSSLRENIFNTYIESGMNVEGFVSLCKSNRPDPSIFKKESKCGFCPYELISERAEEADIIICDFNYLFQDKLLENFLGKIGSVLEDCILVIDEAHNLPDRIRKSHSYSLNSNMIDLALDELKDFSSFNSLKEVFYKINQSFDLLGSYLEKNSINETLIDEDYLVNSLNSLLIDFDDLIFQMRLFETKLKEDSDRIISHVGRVASFLERWRDLGDGFLKTGEVSYRNGSKLFFFKITCLDPGKFSSKIINESHASVLMSATLSPIKMYSEILSIENSEFLELESPFDSENQLTLVVDDVSSKYSSRSFEMYKKIANHVISILNSSRDSNGIIFFPSYDFLDRVLSNINVSNLSRKVFVERRFMTKEEKEDIIDSFKDNSSFFQSQSKVLFAVTSGSFSEGVDLPEDILELVLVVGIPLGVPDIYTKSIIDLYDKKFKKGRLYGYIYPAMSKIIQAAGRCIRTESDRGVVVLLDNRFYFPIFANAFPKSWNLKKTREPSKFILDFFKNK